nr:MAG TPA: hypothetical protein [Caudoviricetes sp.]
MEILLYPTAINASYYLPKQPYRLLVYWLPISLY